MKYSVYSIVVFFCFLFNASAQSGINQFLKPSDTLNNSRKNAVVITEATFAAVTLVALDRLWYADYSRSKFKTLNDNEEWLQMDKLGHVFSAYQLGQLGANTFNWAGMSKKNQLLYGATLGLGFLTTVEVMDGFSQEWGFSWGDMMANGLGTGLYVGQELIWEEQRILLKYSFSRSDFSSQRPEKLGNGLSEEFLKDYNGQTYWLSANISSFLKTENFPKWLNVALGYGADGMLTGNPNDDNFLNQNRVRQFYLSLDVDLTRIKTNSSVLKTIFSVFNIIKVPFPTFSLNSQGAVKWHYIYF